MPEVASSERVMAERQFYKSPSGADLHVTRFIGPDPRQGKSGIDTDDVTIAPMAFLVEQTPHSVIRPHFHRIDQWQMVVEGSGKLGKHAIGGIALHFTHGYTSYGPIRAGDDGVAYFTLRCTRDYGANNMPESRLDLLAHRQASRREVFWGLEPAKSESFLSNLTEPATETIIEHAADGLGAWRFALPPSSRHRGPSAVPGRGQMWVVLNGEVHFGAEVLPRHSCVFVYPNEGVFVADSGRGGAELICLQFPNLKQSA